MNIKRWVTVGIQYGLDVTFDLNDDPLLPYKIMFSRNGIVVYQFATTRDYIVDTHISMIIIICEISLNVSYKSYGKSYFKSLSLPIVDIP